MNPINSIKARLQSRKNTKNSCYWEYVEFYNDGVILEDTVFFESFGGVNFQGNPYYMYKEFFKKEEYKKYKLIIAHKNPDKLKEELILRGYFDDRVSIVKVGTREYRHALCHAKYLVNNVGFSMEFIKKEDQVYFNTWHGTPLKTLGKSVKGDEFAFVNAQRNFLTCDYLLAPNVLTKNVYENEHNVKGIMQGQAYLGGYPRNSIFFDEEERKKVKEKFNLEKVKSIFYMPTWRGGFCDKQKVDQISEIENLAKDLGGEYKVFVKFHPAMQNENTKFTYCYPMPEGIEVYEFLNAIDILITDYSSVFFDYASTNKKIVLYQYDKEEYFKDRGVYKEADESLPFDIAYNYNELLSIVKDNKEIDYTEFLQKFCAFDSINGAKEAVDKLLQGSVNDNGNEVDLYVINFEISEEEIFKLKDKLEGSNYLFTFVLGRTHWNFKNFKQLNYTSLNVYNRLTKNERRKVRWLNLIYALFRSKKALKKLKSYSERERKRLFGKLKINHIYAKNKRLPIAVKYDAENWPKGI